LGYDARFSLVTNKIHLASESKIQQKIIDNMNDKININAYINKNNRVQNIINTLNNMISPETSCCTNMSNLVSLLGSRVDCEQSSMSYISAVSDLNKNAYDDTIIYNKLIENTSTNNYYFDRLAERLSIIDLSKDIAKKGIVVLEKQKKEIIHIKNRMHNVLYRNKKAKVAWVRKLAHFMVKEVTIKCGDQIADHNISDWFESFHEISKKDGVEFGYNKMIGNREDLTIFDDKIKQSYTIAMPFIFYFNKNIPLSIPLNASINTKYEINVTLRTLDEVTYREEFSDFVDPGILNKFNTSLKPFTPSISKSYLMVEYIYLSTEERRIFAANKLEYLIDELQYNNTTTISDDNLIPVYKVGNVKKSVFKIKNKVKIKEEYYDTYKATFMDKNELDKIRYSTDLLPRNDYVPEKYIDRSGVPKIMMINRPIPNVDTYIHKKRIEMENYFNHPTKLMVVLVKPLAHTDLTYRTDESNYFYGEKQWDNYGLYSYYDLSKILDAKKIHYELVKNHLNDLEDSTFGFINIINQLLLDYSNNPNNLSNDKMEKWIVANYAYFLEALQTIKDAYIAYNDQIMYNDEIVHFKENLLSLMIDYHIREIDVLHKLVEDIYGQLKLYPPEQSVTIMTLNEINPCIVLENMDINKNIFTNIVIKLMQTQIKNASITETEIISAINNAYNNYNESQINFLISKIKKIVNISNFSYNLTNLISYLYNLYFSNPLNDRNILCIVSTIYDKLSLVPFHNIQYPIKNDIKNLTYKDIIFQIIENPEATILDNYLKLIPYNVVKIISAKMSQKINKILNDHPVDLINYQKNMVNNPKINPLVTGYLKFNSYSIMPENSNSIMWSEAQAYQYLKHTPNIGINLHLWSFNPLSLQPQGAANLSKIDKFNSVYDIHPFISNAYPATIVQIILSINIMRYMSGMCGKAWES
jgi:hypothetical protein